jgi:hypothetical protein
MLAQILNVITQLRADFGSTEAGYLDAAISGRASQASVDTVDTNVDSILTNTNATTSSRASQTSVDTIDTNVDSIKSTVDTNLDGKVTEAGLKVPTDLTGCINPSARGMDRLDTLGLPETGNVAVGAVQNAWYTVLEEQAAEGIIGFLALIAVSDPAQDYQFRLTIDSVVVFTSATDFWDSGNGVQSGGDIIGQAHANASFADQGGIAFDQIRFTTNFKLEARCTSAAASINFNAYYKYYET